VYGETAKSRIEPILLLPLVENALKHGDLEENQAGFLHIFLSVNADQLCFRVENTFNPDNHAKDRQGGVGLENVQQRLRLLYAGRHVFETKTDPPVFSAFLEIKY
jgi:LytS/YehU family sensor histidine kinase